MCPWYKVGGKMSDKNLEQWINIKFSVKTGKSATEKSALLTLAYDEYAMKKLNVFEWHRRFQEGHEDVQDNPRYGQPRNTENKCKCRQNTNLGALRSKIRCETSSRKIEYGNLFRRRDLNSGLTSGFSTMAMHMHMAHDKLRVQKFLSKKSITKVDRPLYSLT
jgi:hypothetical protein